MYTEHMYVYLTYVCIPNTISVRRVEILEMHDFLVNKYEEVWPLHVEMDDEVGVCDLTHACVCDITHPYVCDMTHEYVCGTTHLHV